MKSERTIDEIKGSLFHSDGKQHGNIEGKEQHTGVSPNLMHVLHTMAGNHQKIMVDAEPRPLALPPANQAPKKVYTLHDGIRRAFRHEPVSSSSEQPAEAFNGRFVGSASIPPQTVASQAAPVKRPSWPYSNTGALPGQALQISPPSSQSAAPVIIQYETKSEQRLYQARPEFTPRQASQAAVQATTTLSPQRVARVLNADRIATPKTQQSQQAGIGISFVPDESDSIVVAHLVPGGPAETCGLLQVGDKVLFIDGIEVKGRTVTDAIRMVLGPKDSNVELVVEKQENPRRILSVIIQRVAPSVTPRLSNVGKPSGGGEQNRPMGSGEAIL
ncbi:hypothetical protein GUITHDRAFT_153826 [Guillardia theta CCMP2712]|uniref:PDZ domain-containing protein n=2 Tax=Guillardia theta TaxID=55529 RepID=L1IZ58_GUITC|nr:hypothetical protein GUITHDRAFT_153826 [Guillardia theta CCMP2712]EKX41531.1 hypothetical protein GUITHDRAFT_153826 [Guillardia theta CCMP2712]|eukprot:XP_005828511.1 hypothetical protein GUITHDRAFT_153826 [Guillardia theta CCMP2712]